MTETYMFSTRFENDKVHLIRYAGGDVIYLDFDLNVEEPAEEFPFVALEAHQARALGLALLELGHSIG